jgi:hypothetical protein
VNDYDRTRSRSDKIDGSAFDAFYCALALVL